MIKWMIVPAILGLICYIFETFIDDISDDGPPMSYSEIATFTFSIILSFLTSVINFIWTRKQSVYAWKWGTTNIEVI